MRQSLNAENIQASSALTRTYVDIMVSTTFWHADWSHIVQIKEHTVSDESDFGMRRDSIQADEFRIPFIDKPGTGHSDRPIQPVLRVPFLASLQTVFINHI